MLLYYAALLPPPLLSFHAAVDYYDAVTPPADFDAADASVATFDAAAAPRRYFADLPRDAYATADEAAPMLQFRHARRSC